jgi:hypothetical protein
MARPPRVTPPRRLVDLQTFADAAGVHVDTVRRWAARDLLPIYRLASPNAKRGRLRVDLNDLDRVVIRQRPDQVSS